MKWLAWLLLLMLVGCNQPESYAPVKVVNQEIIIDPAKSRARPKAATPSMRPVQPPASDSGEARQQPPAFAKQYNPPSSRAFSLQDSRPRPTQPVPGPTNKTQAVEPKIKTRVKPVPVDKNAELPDKTAKQVPQPRKNKPGPQPGTAKNKALPAPIAATEPPPSTKKTADKTSTISINNKKVLKLNFGWPIRGKVIKNYAQSDRKGIDIAVKNGQTVVHAAEAGKAVYCGQGLAGYGQLIIIKHDADYLSAYAHNSQLNISEGQHIVKGQPIALIGGKKPNRGVLHFEIRKRGQALNPLTLLPKN